VPGLPTFSLPESLTIACSKIFFLRQLFNKVRFSLGPGFVLPFENLLIPLDSHMTM